MNKQLSGRITINRTQSSHDVDAIHIQIVDELSGIRVLDLTMSVEALGYALTGLALQPCRFDLYGTELVGKGRQHKSEPLFFQMPPTFEQVVEAAKDYEADGWKCSQYKGSHIEGKWNKERTVYTVNVPFVRYVDKQP